MGIRLIVRGAGDGGEDLSYDFGEQRVAIGRSAGADVRLPDTSVSARHAIVRPDGAGFVIEDEGSTNGTSVNGTRLPEKRPKPLRPGDLLRIGRFTIEARPGAAVIEPTNVEKTAALARRIVREALRRGGNELPEPKVTVVHGPDAGRSAPVPPAPARIVVGRGETCDVPLRDADASREHAEIARDLDGVVVRDLGSKNGVLVNDRPVKEKRLRDRDEITVGRTVLVYEDPEESALRATEAEADTPAPPPEPTPAPATPVESVALPAAPAPPAPAPEAAPARRSSPAPRVRSPLGADAFIYVLAAVVLALSLAGLFVLLRAE